MFGIARRQRQQSDKTQVKRTLKYMSICHDPRVQREILRTAPDEIYKAVFNAAYNVAINPDLNLSLHQKKFFKRYRKPVAYFVSHKVPFKTKKRTLQRGKGVFLAAIIPSLLSVALSALGSKLFQKE